MPKDRGKDKGMVRKPKKKKKPSPNATQNTGTGSVLPGSKR